MNAHLLTGSTPTSTTRVPLFRTPHLAVGGAALTIGAAVITTQVTGTPAYAVTTNPDGTVSVTVNHIADPAAANRDLRASGTRLVIMMLSPEKDCPVRLRSTPLPTRLSDGFKLNQVLVQSDHHNVVVLRPDSIPADAVLIAVPLQSNGGAGPRLVVGWYAAPGPTCVVDPFSPSPTDPDPAGSVTPGPDVAPR